MASEPATGINTRLQRSTADRVEPHSQALGQNDKRNNGESGQGANQQRQNAEKPVPRVVEGANSDAIDAVAAVSRDV